ncbi:hypothetical protein Scep_004499 [Stephania cephalantha]|uniref:Uncharacterized protein n=1 Tax=Stephania cephalantha TaxID=152367 RepID=A0AAP0KTH4_9MAGN
MLTNLSTPSARELRYRVCKPKLMRLASGVTPTIDLFVVEWVVLSIQEFDLPCSHLLAPLAIPKVFEHLCWIRIKSSKKSNIGQSSTKLASCSHKRRPQSIPDGVTQDVRALYHTVNGSLDRIISQRPTRFSSRKLECGISIGIRRINDWLKIQRENAKFKELDHSSGNDTGVVADTNGVHAIWFILFLEQGDNNGIALHRFDSKDLPRQHGIDFELHVIASEIREKIGEYREKHPCSGKQ